MQIIFDPSHVSNSDDIEALIVHCPRETRVMHWDDHARTVLYPYLRSIGWIERRTRTAINLITPVHPLFGEA